MRRDTTKLTFLDVSCGNCEELREKFHIDESVKCCQSCHREAYEYAEFHMSEYYEGDHVWVACCGISKAMKDKGVWK